MLLPRVGVGKRHGPVRSSIRRRSLHSRGHRFSGGFLLTQVGAAALFARFFVILVGAKFFLHPASFDQLFETA